MGKTRVLGLLVFTGLLSVVGCASIGDPESPPPDERPTFVLVRHAEKASDGTRDPALTREGRVRAEHLATFLSRLTVSHVFSSDYARTRDTARPVADQHRLEVSLYDPRRLEPFAQRIADLDDVVVVVGHSNTTPGLVTLLGGEAVPPIDEAEYGRLYLLVPGRDGYRTVVLEMPSP